jgi:hypothetical protein
MRVKTELQVWHKHDTGRTGVVIIAVTNFDRGIWNQRDVSIKELIHIAAFRARVRIQETG